MKRIEIKSWLTGSVLFEGDFSCISEAVTAAIRAKANLSYANLSYANLSYAAHSWAQVAFMSHGECGRMLTAIQIKKSEGTKFFCGCFTGSENQLRKYIGDGAQNLRKTRTLALNTVLTLLAARNDE